MGLVHGLDMFHIAELTGDTTDAALFETPTKLEGAVNVKVDPKTESTTFWADNSAYDVINSLGDIDVDLEVADLPLTMQKKIYNMNEVNGVQFSNKDDQPINLALGFRAKVSSGGYRYYWLLKGKPELLPIEHKTDEGKADPQTSKIKLKFMPLQHNGNWKAQAETEQLKGLDWFKEVIYDESQLNSTP